MRVVSYVVIGIVAVLLVLRRLRARRTGTARRSRLPALVQGRTFLGDTGLVAAREMRDRLRGRLFRVVTVLLLVVVAAAIVIPTLHSTKKTVAVVGVLGTVAAPVQQQIALSAEKSGTTLRFVPERDAHEAQTALREGRATVVIVDDGSVLVKTSNLLSGTTTQAEVAHTVATVLGIADAFTAAGLTPGQASAIVGAKPVPVRSLVPAKNNAAARSTSVIGLVLVFVMLTQYLTWTLMGVMEEKTSRVVEVLLATVRPLQLLGGKVLGIGLVALLQAGIVVGFALVLAKAVGSDLLQGTAPSVVVATLVWLVLGYAFYSWVYAAAGSMTARQAQVQSLALPLSVPIIIGYIVGLTGAATGSSSLLIKVFAYLPPTAPFGIPVLVAHGQATWWELLLSALISVACTVGVAHVAARIYRRAVLQTGRRLTIKELLASER